MTTLQSTAPTFDDVWRTIQELALMSKETDRKFQETDRQIQATSQQMKETDRMIKTMSKQLGAHGNRLGEFVQEMVRPAVVRLFRQRHLPVHQVMANLIACDDNGQFRAEIDLLVINTDTAIAIECKSRLTLDDINEHLERLAIFKDCFPQYSRFTLLGAVAAMVLPQDVSRLAYRKGLFVLAQSGDAVEIRNDDSFQPQRW